MAIEVSCDNCGEEFRVKDEAAGKSFKCKVCGTAVHIPDVIEEEDDIFSPPRRRERYDDERDQPTRRKTSSSAAGNTLGPAIGLYVTGVLSFIGGCLLLVLVLTMEPLDPEVPPNADEQERIGHLIGFYGALYGPPVLTPLIALLVLFGGFCLQTQRFYVIAIIACIVASIPCISPGCVLGIPFGVWGLIVLGQEDVKRSFR